MAVFIGDTVVKRIFLGSTEITDDNNVHLGSDPEHIYTYTISFNTDDLENVTLNDTTDIEADGYFGQVIVYTRTLSADDGYETPVFDVAPSDSDHVAYSTDGNTLTITITMPHQDASETVNLDGSATYITNDFEFGDWTGAVSTDTIPASGGTPSATVGNAAAVSVSAVPSRSFNDGCQTNTVEVTVTLEAPSGYDNTGEDVEGTANVSQSAFSKVNVGNPTQDGVVSTSGGPVDFTNSKYSTTYAFSPRSFNDGCSQKSATVIWTYTETSGNYCNNTDTGNITVHQAAFPSLPFGSATQSGIVPASGGTPTFTNSQYTTSYSFSDRGFNSGCTNKTATATVTRTATSGSYCNNTATNDQTVSQAPYPAVSVGNPTQSGIVPASGGSVTFTNSSYSASISARGFNSGCHTASVSANWTYTVSSGDFCNNSDTGTVTVQQASHPAVNVGNPTQSGTAPASGGSVTFTNSNYSASVGARGFNSGCSNTSVSVGWTYTVSSGNYCNNSDTGTVTIQQAPHPQVNVSNPTQSGVAPAGGGAVTFTDSKYSASIGARGFNSGCHTASVSVGWTYVATSGNFCNNSDTGTVTVQQASHPEVSVGNPTQSGTISSSGGKAIFTNSKYTQDTSTDASTSSDGCSTYSQTVNWTYTETSGNFCNSTDTGSVSVNQAALSMFSISGASLDDGTTGDSITSADWSWSGGGTYSSTSPGTYAAGSNTYTLTVTAPNGYCNTSDTATDTATGTSATPCVSQTYGAGSTANAACADSHGLGTTFYTDNKFLTSATSLSSNSNCSSNANAQWVSDGLTARYWNGTGFNSVSNLCEL